MCHSSVRIVYADPYDTATSFTTSLMVMCWSAHTSSFNFQIVSAFTEIESIPMRSSSSSNPCPHLKWLHQSQTTFFKSIIPINSMQGLQHFCRILPEFAHEWDVGSFLKLNVPHRSRYIFTQTALAHKRKATIRSHFPHTCIRTKDNTSSSNAAILQPVEIQVRISGNFLVCLCPLCIPTDCSPTKIIQHMSMYQYVSMLTAQLHKLYRLCPCPNMYAGRLLAHTNVMP